VYLAGLEASEGPLAPFVGLQQWVQMRVHSWAVLRTAAQSTAV